MKTKEEILKMTKEELVVYKWSKASDMDAANSDGPNCSDCYHCSDCSGCADCSYCSNCSDCYQCRNANGLKYAICNIEVGKEAYEKKMKELKGQGG